MPAWSTAVRDLRNLQWLPQWKRQRPGVKTWKNYLDLTASGATIVSAARQLKANNQTNNGPVAQSWTGSLAFACSPPCGPATPVSALPPRLRRGRG